MPAVIFRIVLLALGLGAVEIGLGAGVVEGSTAGWALVLLVGLPLVVAGSAGFMAPMFGGSVRGPRRSREDSTHA
jgi:hypothetical protein